MISAKDALGIAGAGKYVFQASRAFQGLSTTTPVTAGLDLLSGTVGLQSASNVGAVLKAGSTLTKGAVGATKISNLGKVANFAAKASPIVAKGSAVLSAALGGIEIGKGVKNVKHGEVEKGKEQIVAGAADVVTAGALYAAAATSATIAGIPVAGVALAVAGVSQAGKYAYKFRHPIGQAATKLANGATKVAKSIGTGISKGAQALGSKAALASNEIRTEAVAVAQKVSAVVTKGADNIKQAFKRND